MSTSAVAFEASVRRMIPVTVPEEQRDGLTALLRLLQATRSASDPEPCKLTSPTGEALDIPRSVFLLLEKVIEGLERGDAITVVPVMKEMTTQQAASILNVSRQYLVRLLDKGVIPHRRTGTHRRIYMKDLITFKHARDQDRMDSLDTLSQLTQDFGGYDLMPD